MKNKIKSTKKSTVFFYNLKFGVISMSRYLEEGLKQHKPSSFGILILKVCFKFDLNFDFELIKIQKGVLFNFM